MSSAVTDIAKKRRGLVARRVLLNLRAREPAMGASAEEVESWGGLVVKSLEAFEDFMGPGVEDDEVEEFVVLASARLEEFGYEDWLEWGSCLMPVTAHAREKRLAKEAEGREAAAGNRVGTVAGKERQVAKLSGVVGDKSAGSTSQARVVSKAKGKAKVTATVTAEVAEEQQAHPKVPAKSLTRRSAKGKLDKVTASTSKEVDQDEALPAGAFEAKVACQRCATLKSIQPICCIVKEGSKCLKCERDDKMCSLLTGLKRPRQADDTPKEMESQSPAKKMKVADGSHVDSLEADTSKKDAIIAGHAAGSDSGISYDVFTRGVTRLLSELARNEGL
ncbi:hypothetical protein EW146_g9286 [Bondarzewia mesenterica]|uniref:Uncharacterized protein n=1 Tax=Bondarzewia mesenterica TaxID=1095465 RepID=A0A4S4L841_9AGAM|nr:hypothetical protein EW146_g9286 [Bondarzewia mesenterica]